MNDLKKRIRSLEELVFRVVLETKAETMAIRDILIEKDIVSHDRWDSLVEGHKTSYNAFRVVTEINKRYNGLSSSALKDPGAEGVRGLGDRPEGQMKKGEES
jgi:hypothetical protein